MAAKMPDKITLPQGQVVYYANEVTSTNDLIAEWGKEGAEPFTTLWADSQSKGRGRLGRKWQTYPGVGLAFSVLVPGGGALLPIAVSVALHRALAQFLPAEQQESLTIKWPNDIQLRGKKLAGILIESHAGGDGSRFYVVGVGLNVRQPAGGFADAPQAVALEAATPTPPERAFVLGAILQALQKTLDLTRENTDHAPIVNHYKANCGTFGQHVVWRDSGEEIEGIARDMTPEGHLILETENGVKACHVGEVIATGNT